MRKVKVAAVQMRCTENVNENIANAERLVREAAADGAQIILLPELFERQYFCQERQYEYYEFAKPVEENDAVKHFAKVAEELKVVLPISFYEKDGKRCMSYLSNGNTIERVLDFYEVEVQIESTSRYPVHGIANVVHMREVSKKRLSRTPVATVTEQTYNDIASAVAKNISQM